MRTYYWLRTFPPKHLNSGQRREWDPSPQVISEVLKSLATSTCLGSCFYWFLEDDMLTSDRGSVRISLGDFRGTLSGSVNPRHCHCCLGDGFGKNSWEGAGPADPTAPEIVSVLMFSRCSAKQKGFSDGSNGLTFPCCLTDLLFWGFKIPLP